MKRLQVRLFFIILLATYPHAPQVVLQQIMLRRRKDQTLNGEVLIKLPKRTVQVISCKFDDSESRFYDALESKMEGVIEKLMSSGQGNSSYISVLLLLLRLRQGISLVEVATS